MTDGVSAPFRGVAITAPLLRTCPSCRAKRGDGHAAAAQDVTQEEFLRLDWREAHDLDEA